MWGRWRRVCLHGERRVRCLQLCVGLSETRKGAPPPLPTLQHVGASEAKERAQRLQPLNHKGRLEGHNSRKFIRSQSELKGVWWEAHPTAGLEWADWGM